jgi:hypothetical protein
MTRDDIIRMAREAGLLPHPENIVYQDTMFEGRIKTFAALVAAAEREACARVCEKMWHEWLNSPEENEPNKPDAEDCYRAIRRRA